MRMVQPLLAAVIGLSGLQANGSLTELGPKVGDLFPAFEAEDQHGQTQSIDTLRGANGLLLVFYRSADW